MDVVYAVFAGAKNGDWCRAALGSQPKPMKIRLHIWFNVETDQTKEQAEE